MSAVCLAPYLIATGFSHSAESVSHCYTSTVVGCGGDRCLRCQSRSGTVSTLRSSARWNKWIGTEAKRVPTRWRASCRSRLTRLLEKGGRWATCVLREVV